MKDKEKQIEEMAKDLCVYCHNMTEEKECPYSEHEESKQKCWDSQLEQAKTLYDLGYRKLPEDSVVLSRKEYEKLKLAKDICCHDLFIATKQSHEEGYKRGYDKGKYEERKETAEKIICIIKTFSYDKEFTKIITRIISERFGVEIKENNYGKRKSKRD